MRLVTFKYRMDNWRLSAIDIVGTNLIVGKNATGKTKALTALSHSIDILMQKSEIDRISEIETEFEFEDNGNVINYRFTSDDGVVTGETLTVDGKQLLKREGGSAQLLRTKVNPPDNRLVLQVRRDTEKYPYIEKIMRWAENMFVFRFNEIDRAGDSDGLLRASNGMYTMFDIVKALSDEERKSVVADFKELGFNLRKISIIDGARIVLFWEDKVPQILLDINLSNGMLRSISLMLLVKYLTIKESPSALVIDDLGEGLDYERATRLGKYLFNLCEEHGIQLIASSNDAFMMNVVDMEQWNILYRDGENVYSLNRRTSPEFFENVKFSGLNNFDIFTSNLLAAEVKRIMSLTDGH